MSTMGSIILGLGGILHSLLTIYIWVVIIAALISWVRPDPYNPIVQVLGRLTEPAYAFVRRLFPTVFNGIDLLSVCRSSMLSWSIFLTRLPRHYDPFFSGRLASYKHIRRHYP